MCIYTAQFDSHWAYVSIEHCKGAECKLKCAISVQYTPDFEDIACKKYKPIKNIDYILKCNNVDVFIKIKCNLKINITCVYWKILNDIHGLHLWLASYFYWTVLDYII